jgi:hypothetical protein
MKEEVRELRPRGRVQPEHGLAARMKVGDSAPVDLSDGGQPATRMPVGVAGRVILVQFLGAVSGCETDLRGVNPI